MLVVSVVMSSILLLVALLASRPSKIPVGTVFLSGVVCVLLPFFAGVILPALVLQAILLVAVAQLCQSAGWRIRRFVALSCVASLAAYGIVGGIAYKEVTRFQEKFPYVSMNSRLPAVPRPHPTQLLAEAAAGHLDTLEERIDGSEPRTWSGSMRVRQLQKLHERTVEVFASRPGFGMARMLGMSERTLQGGLRPEQPIPQPGTRITFTWSTGDLEMAAPANDNFEQNWQMHSDSIVDFVNVPGFGYFKDRQQVAGFQAHQFSQAPTPAEHWILQSVDLVGLLLHDEPVVYVTANLPRMEELRGAATRQLDDFEAAGLAALGGGDDLFQRETTAGRRLLGAIRSARQCVACHDRERGDLLGAFSYTLTRDK
jgi:hypothetical protein